MGEQHTDMYLFGEKGGKFSLESMRNAARLRLKKWGWTSTIHMHSYIEDCSEVMLDGETVPCEQFSLDVPPPSVSPSSDKDYA